MSVTTERVNIKVYNAVLERSKARGGGLAFLLVLAKYADDDGVCFPSINTLADHLRITTRAVQILQQKLADKRELEIEVGAGPNGVNVYKVCCLAARQKPDPLKKFSGVKVFSGGVKSRAQGGEKLCEKGVKNFSPKELLIGRNNLEKRTSSSPTPSSSNPNIRPDDDETQLKKPSLPAPADYIGAVLRLYAALPGTAGRIRRVDRRFASDLRNRGVPLDVVESALWLGTARHVTAHKGPMKTFRPIRMLKYFADVLTEVQKEPPPRSQIEYVRHSITRWMTDEWRDSRREGEAYG